jgi:dynein heavy chain
LQQAVQAVKDLNKSDISELKAFANPPMGVRMVMESICILMGEKTDWDSAKKMMSQADFLKSLQEFKADNVHPVMKKLQPYLTNELFTEEKMLSVSKAGAALCKWVNAMVIYAKISREVEPKKKRLKEMQQTLADKEAALAEKRAKLKGVLDRVEMLKKMLEDTLNDKKYWVDQMSVCQRQLVTASKLTVGLADEEKRWAVDSASLAVQINELVGDAFLSAACISYFGPFTGEYREALVSQWLHGCGEKQIPVSARFSLANTLGDPVIIREWNLNGLPTDSVSIDSALLREYGQRWPLFIDPQGQAKRWIRNDFKGKILLTRFSDPNLLQNMRNAVVTGQPAIIEDIQETLEPAIETIILKQTYKQVCICVYIIFFEYARVIFFSVIIFPSAG